MTAEQLAQALIVAIATALATSVVNNFFEVRRLRAMWKRETEDRIARDRRQRLEDRLGIVRGHVSQYVEAMTLSAAAGPHWPLISGDIQESMLDMIRGFGTAETAAYEVGDDQLIGTLHELQEVMAPAVSNEGKGGEITEDEMRELMDQLIEKASQVHDRCRELIETEEMRALSEE